MTMTYTSSPSAIAKAHERAAHVVEHLLRDFSYSADELAAIKQTLLDRARTLSVAVVVMELYSDGKRLQCLVNGQYVPFCGVGLLMAWSAFAARQAHLPPIRLEWIFRGKRWSASAVQARDRAAVAVERISPALARAIQALGVEGGVLVLKGNPQVRVKCKMDDRLLALFAAADVNSA